MTGVFLFLICLEHARFSHEAWFYTMQIDDAAPPKPMQYANAFRLAIPAAVRLAGKVHINDVPLVFSAIDFITGVPALFLLYLLATDVPPGEPRSRRSRAVTILFFLAFLQFPMAWIIPWQRPETLPSTLYLAICLYWLSKIETNLRWAIAIVVASFLQVFLRADVPFSLGVAIALIGFSTTLKQGFNARRYYVITGSLIAVISGAIQQYMHTLYPNMKLDFQLKRNLTIHNFETAFLALLPFILFSIFLVTQRPPLRNLDKVVLLTALLYLPMYFTYGVLSEVRIYEPFMLSTSMVVARVSASYLNNKLDAAG